MGIRFKCSNGHKLNVKTFLAGKKGKCPKCGIVVQIPLQSELSKRSPEAISATAVANDPAKIRDLDSDSSSDYFVQGIDAQQYGPATRDQLNVWIAEGRLTPECSVWRQGWADWKSVAEVFPNEHGVPKQHGGPNKLDEPIEHNGFDAKTDGPIVSDMSLAAANDPATGIRLATDSTSTKALNQTVDKVSIPENRQENDQNSVVIDPAAAKIRLKPNQKRRQMVRWVALLALLSLVMLGVLIYVLVTNL